MHGLLTETTWRCLIIMVLSSASSQAQCSGVSCEHDSEDLQALLQNGRPHVDREETANLHVLDDTLDSDKTQEGSLLERSADSLRRIMTGDTTKSEVEIVLSQYDEDIKWSDPYENVRTIYCKNTDPAKRPKNCIPLPNVGREGHTYVNHIVNNYYNLSNWTVFSQAGAPSAGYKGHRLGGGHMLPGVSFDSYLLPEHAGGLPREDGSVFVFTGALHMPTLNHSLRLSFLGAAKAPALHSQPKCPKTELLDGWQRWWDLGWFKKWIGERCGVSQTETAKLFLTYWDNMVDMDRPPNDIIFFTQGARFAASRERIHQRPREFYEALLTLLDKDKDPCHNYFNEWVWYYIIGKPTKVPCDQQLLISEASRSDWQGTKSLLEEARAKSLLRQEDEGMREEGVSEDEAGRQEDEGMQEEEKNEDKTQEAWNWIKGETGADLKDAAEAFQERLRKYETAREEEER